jgi:hypothetical protein
MCIGIICLLGLAQGCTCGEGCTCKGEFELGTVDTLRDAFGRTCVLGLGDSSKEAIDLDSGYDVRFAKE